MATNWRRKRLDRPRAGQKESKQCHYRGSWAFCRPVLQRPARSSVHHPSAHRAAWRRPFRRMEPADRLGMCPLPAPRREL